MLNILVYLGQSFCKKKSDYSINHFATQNNKQRFTSETFTSILRIRGIEFNALEQYAEGFYCRKIGFLKTRKLTNNILQIMLNFCPMTGELVFGIN